jgi:Flp pilus assembly protein TadG
VNLEIRLEQIRTRLAALYLGGFLHRGGSAAVEFAVTLPLLVAVATGFVDFGMLAAKTDALAGATRIGAEYALNGPTCKSGSHAIQLLKSPPVDPTCTSAIQSSITGSMTFSPALTFPASFPVTCYCNDTPTPLVISCSASCATQTPVRPGPKRAFITISATQSFTPLIPWPGVPASLGASTELRLQ